MKSILALALLSILTFAAPPFTVENVGNLRVLIVANTELITKDDIASIKVNIEERLLKNHISINETDPNTLMIKIETIEINKINIANIQLIIGEEVKTKRIGKIETLAFTYFTNDFFEIEESTDIKDSIEFLTDQFLELYKEDME